MSPRTLPDVLIAETPAGREIRPTLGTARLQLAMLVLMAALWAAIGAFFVRIGGEVAIAFFGIPMALFTLQLLAYGVAGWRRRNTPLVIEPTGRVRYGDQELCPPGSVEFVRVVPDPQSEADGHKVMLRLTSGADVELPGPYFASFLTRYHALRFADELASALNVQAETPP
jgi:hypothetical protein